MYTTVIHPGRYTQGVHHCYTQGSIPGLGGSREPCNSGYSRVRRLSGASYTHGEAYPGCTSLLFTHREAYPGCTPLLSHREAYPGCTPLYTGRHTQGVHHYTHREAYPGCTTLSYTGRHTQGVYHSLIHREAYPGCTPLSRFTVGLGKRPLSLYPFHCWARKEVSLPSPVSLLG